MSIQISTTSEFQTAIAAGQLEAAETWLNGIRLNPENWPQYDARWLDHRERELFRALCKAHYWSGAKRIVEVTADPTSKIGRLNRLEELSGLKYDQVS